MRPERQGSGGFSLVELLVVIAIAAILAALSAPAIMGVLRSSSLTTGGANLSGQLNAARQYAMSRNCQVEFRFYQLPDPTTPSATTPSVFRAFQSLMVPASGPTDIAITKVTFLPNQVALMSNAVYSSLLAIGASGSPTYVAGTTANTPLGPYPPNSYNYYAFHFNPDGSTDLNPNSAQAWFVSLVNLPLQSSTSLPANFITLQINALSGRVSNYRPN